MLHNFTYYGYWVVHVITCYLILKQFGVIWALMALISVFPLVVPEVLMFVSAKINNNVFYMMLILGYVVVFLACYIDRVFLTDKTAGDVDYLHWYHNMHWHWHGRH